MTFDHTALGIDPGMDGYLVVLVAGESKPRFHPAPLLAGKSKAGRRRYDLPGLLDLVTSCRELAPEVCVLEKQQPMPVNGGIGNFQAGLGYGLWRMALTAAQIPHYELHPRTWKAELGVMGTGSNAKARRNDGKRRAIELAQQLYPGVSLLPTERSRTPSSDMAEALLLAHSARRIM